VPNLIVDAFVLKRCRKNTGRCFGAVVWPLFFSHRVLLHLSQAASGALAYHDLSPTHKFKAIDYLQLKTEQK
jgi:hypothetical protein